MTEEQGKTPHSGNYVANDVERPTSVFFANQRVVKIVDGALAVSWTWEEREEERPDPSDPMYPYRMALKGINAEYTEAKLRASLAAREKDVLALGEALAFYADPDTYFAVAFAFDLPCGGFVADFSEDEKTVEYNRPMPGKSAREALANVTPSALAIEQRIRDDGIEAAATALDTVKASAPDGVTKLYLHTLAIKVRALKGAK
jgi:hypothetical protein